MNHPTDSRLATFATALLEVPAHLVAATARTVLRREFGVGDAELYLADYRETTLVPAITPDATPLPVAGTAAGRAFTTRTAVTDGDTVYLPVLVRYNRLGVLGVSGADPGSHDLFATAAALLGHELVVADTATDRFRRVRRRQRLTLAAEMQWDLLPGRRIGDGRFELAGHLEPAYAVHGDNFDWSLDSDELTLTVTNGSGTGVGAAMLTGLTVHAMRNARRAGLALADQLALAGQAVWAEYGGKQHVATLALRLHLPSGRLAVADAGSPALYRLRGGDAERIELDAQLPLGMFDGVEYDLGQLALRQGDRLLVLSDGVLNAATTAGRYVDTELDRVLAEVARLSPADAVHLVLSRLVAFHASAELADDAVAVLLEWRGGQR
ncbi:PP2C family protein-serine/threonine phosphatase [Amycolatopsis suaedae]|uniref:Serine/threonine-protein phosphatase n=1 Tax=Amycolatopsis suaedae TaxID=2510978 RepID=A0A4Q7J288_9PSEU|nr:PP2C family protein-serine/threonine phosphatase [Amycolatopsis suaedae]RZQ60513.1 serine/threonine-protein phosphatase [Amycolatopsis suaedae]